MRPPALVFGMFLLFGVPAPAHASPFTFQYADTISGGVDLGGLGLAVGQPAVITVVLDNGGSDNVSETWTAADLESLTFNFNNGGLVTTFSAPFDGGLAGSTSGSFITNAAGILTSVTASWADFLVDADFVTTGTATTFSWTLSSTAGSNYLEEKCSTPPCASEFSTVGLLNVSGMRDPANWQPVDTTPAPVPEPATLSLLGLGLAGVVARRRMKRR